MGAGPPIHPTRHREQSETMTNTDTTTDFSLTDLYDLDPDTAAARLIERVEDAAVAADAGASHVADLLAAISDTAQAALWEGPT